jgi:hypothetical protein
MNMAAAALPCLGRTPFTATSAGGSAAIDGEIRHLWHGELADRRAGERHAGLAAHAFDPRADIVGSAADGAWRWASNKPALHSYVRQYFR